MTTFEEAFESLPNSTSVYVVYDVRGHRIHVKSRTVPAIYSVVKQQWEDSEGGDRAEEDMAFMRRHRENLTWDITGDDYDFEGYFDGVPLGAELNTIGGENRHPILISFDIDAINAMNPVGNTVIIPYDGCHLSDAVTESFFSETWEETETSLGEFTCRKEPISVMYPQHPSHFIFIKIHQSMWIYEREFANGSLFYETVVSAPLSDNILNISRTRAVEIVRAALMNDSQHPAYLKQLMAVNWPVTVHDHITID